LYVYESNFNTFNKENLIKNTASIQRCYTNKELSGKFINRENHSPEQHCHRTGKVNVKVSVQFSCSAAAKSLQSCPTLCDPIDGSPPGSPVPGILQARALEWVPGTKPTSPALQGSFLTTEPPGKSQNGHFVIPRFEFSVEGGGHCSFLDQGRKEHSCCFSHTSASLPALIPTPCSPHGHHSTDRKVGS